MSVDYLYSSIIRIEKDLASLSKKISDETKKEMHCQKRIQQIQKSITKNTSVSSYNSKISEINRNNNEIIKCQEKISKFRKEESDKRTKLQKLNQKLLNEQNKENKKTTALAQKLEALQQNVNQYLKAEYSNNHIANDKQYDLFISHATEDKEDLVRPLAEELENIGVKVWYDEFALRLGDSLREKIDYGLSHSSYGAVILSNSFFSKKWPQYELNGLVAREMNGHKVILPIWHKVTKNEVINFSPTLADKLALNSVSYSIEEMAKELKEIIYN